MTNRPCVLLADDDPDEVYLLRWALQKAGLNLAVMDLPDGVMTIEYLEGVPPFDDRTLYPLPNLLLLDLKMPKRNGLDVLAWMRGRSELSGLPVVVISASAFENDCEAAKNLGASDYIIKPTDLDELVRMMKDLGHRWLGPQVSLCSPVVATRCQTLPQRSDQNRRASLAPLS